jgi:hypothetical protein
LRATPQFKDERRNIFREMPVKRLHVFVAALLFAALAPPAVAQVFGQFGGAEPVAVDHRLFGAYAGFSTNQSDFLGQLRLSFYPGVDFGFQGGLARLSAAGHSRTTILLGGDLKAQVASRSATFPVDLALGGTLGLSSADQFSQLAIGPIAIASITHELSSNAALIPYGGAALLFTRNDIGTENSTDVSLQLRFGLEARPNPDFRIVLELQAPMSDPVDKHPKMVLGANFPF